MIEKSSMTLDVDGSIITVKASKVVDGKVLRLSLSMTKEALEALVDGGTDMLNGGRRHLKVDLLEEKGA